MNRRSTSEPRDRPARVQEREKPLAVSLPPTPLRSYRQVLDLQHAVGNQAVGTLLRQPTVAPPAPVKPKTDEEQWAEDWDDPAFASARHHFKGDDRPKGTPRHRYDVLCPLYKKQGIKRPLKYVHDNIVEVSFFGHSTSAHRDLKAALVTAEAALKAKGYTKAPFRKCWAFNPRTTSEGNWSNHADGKAIDIDDDTNPRLIDKQRRKVITALTGIDVSASDPGKKIGLDNYDASKLASGLFQMLYSPTGMAVKIALLEQWALEFGRGVETRKEELAAVPKGKHATADDKKRATEIKSRLKALEADIARVRASQGVLTKEKARYEKRDRDISKLEAEVETITAEMERLETDIAAATDKKAAAALTKKRKAKGKQLKDTLDKLGEKRADPLRTYARQGFLDLNKDLVDALKDAGLHWGGEVWTAKDYMHFQVAPH